MILHIEAKKKSFELKKKTYRKYLGYKKILKKLSFINQQKIICY